MNSRALVQATAKQMDESVRGMNGASTPWLPGYRIKVLDGNCIEATEHRIKVLRGTASGALPGKSLVSIGSNVTVSDSSGEGISYGQAWLP